MSEAPKGPPTAWRIDDGQDGFGYFTRYEPLESERGIATKYIRADIHDETVRQRDRLLDALRESVIAYRLERSAHEGSAQAINQMAKVRPDSRLVKWEAAIAECEEET